MEKKITGRGRNKADSEKNAALRACVFLEQNIPEFQTLRLPANARLARDRGGATLGALQTGPGSDHGLTPLNAANFLYYCRDTGRLIVSAREPQENPGGGFIGRTVIDAKGRKKAFQSGMRNRKKDAQNDADLLAAVWVVENLGIKVPANYRKT